VSNGSLVPICLQIGSSVPIDTHRAMNPCPCPKNNTFLGMPPGEGTIKFFAKLLFTKAPLIITVENGVKS